ncbi:hypothetical protein BDV18DRAFT_134498 [Aspergillus unguis]
MAYFLPSFFQKRLLKYALSRLELVDTEALDLDSLGIRWGQRSTVELRDIGLRLEKLATLLHLPPSSKLLSARIRHLKLTVPADIYSSGIICEASGIDIHLRLPSEKEASHVKDHLFAAHESIILNPADLAESFLQAEPKEEKEELQAAISSRSEVLHRTSASISDDEEELGLGEETTSLPSFVAAFLKGVGDRLQVQVDDISVRLDVETKQEGSSKRQPEEKPDLISAVLSIRQVNVGAVATTTPTEEHSVHLGKRPVSLFGIELALVSEPVVFSNYSRFTAPTSPSTSRSKFSQPPSPAPSIPPAPSSVSSSTDAMMQSTIFRPLEHDFDSEPDEPNFSRLEASAYTYDGRFSDADTEEARSYGHLGNSQDLLEEEKLLDNPSYLDSVIDSQLQGDDLDGLTEPPSDAFNRLHIDTSTPQLQGSAVRDSEGESTHSVPAEALAAAAASAPNMRHVHQSHLADEDYGHRSSMPILTHRTEDNPVRYIQPSHAVPESPSGSSSSGSGSEYFQDQLSESKLFSKEEAQSMYMSAMSHGTASDSFMPNMPGAWESPEESTKGPVHQPGPLGELANATVDQDDQDRTPISTPKPTDQEEYISRHAANADSQNFSSEPSNKQSVPSSDANEIPDVAKRFLYIDRVTVWIPSTKQDEEHDDPSESFYAESEGSSFKGSTAYLEASHDEEKSVSISKDLPSQPRPNELASTDAVPKPHHKRSHRSLGTEYAVSFEISSVEVQFDIAIGWLVLKFGQRVIQAFCAAEPPSANQKPLKKNTQRPQPYSLTLGKLSVRFIEHVPEKPFPPGMQQDSSTTFHDFLQESLIFQAQLSGAKAHLSISSYKTKLSAEVSKFTIGVASEDLISFREEMKMRESTRDILSPVGSDISFSLSKSQDSATFTLSTLPLCVNLNILRLEEVLGWFGGLSTIMELGNSISSVSGNKTTKKDTPRARGVRFEEGPPPNKSQTADVPWKVNARIGGIALDVTGENHYLALRTTAAKIINRSEALAVQIDKATFSGPFSLLDARDAPAEINLNSVRAEFLYNPKEPDLTRLVSLITPSKAKYDEDDDIMLDTLLRQRKQGSVLRVNVKGAKVAVTRPEIEPLQQLAEELGRLSNVTKYLPEDDRPGILTLALIRDLEARVHVDNRIGTITARLEDAEAAHISIPSLIATSLGSITITRNDNEELVGEALAPQSVSDLIPTLMVRFIADEMDPTVKVKVHNLRVEYTVPVIMAFLGISDEMTPGDVAANMASSLANLADLHPPSQESSKEGSVNPIKPMKLDVALRDCVIGLNPRGTAARGLLVLTKSRFNGAIHDISTSEATLDLRKASILIIDDVDCIGLESNSPQRGAAPQSSLVQALMGMGYVSVSTISSATATVKVMRLSEDGAKSLDVEVRDDLLILETCADSTQTLINIMNGLQPPRPPDGGEKYRTQVAHLRESLIADTFNADLAGDSPEILDKTQIPDHDDIGDIGYFDLEDPASGVHEQNQDFQSQYHVSSSVSELDFKDDHFTKKSSIGGTAHRWDAVQHTYGLSDESVLRNSPLRVRVRDAHVIWNLFDGYDWQRTRDTISKAVKDVEKRATERRASRTSPGFDDEPEAVIGDCLFNSVYIGIPANRDPAELRANINYNIDDLASETGSYATTSTVTTVRGNRAPSVKGKKLRLSRSRSHKMTFELKGICADLVVFPPGEGETINSIDVRVNELEIFDHLPTSTWKKFATYMSEAGEKEDGTSMVHLEVLTVKTSEDTSASELVLKVTILPLRLHVDHDALDFLSRFFEFRDESATPSGPPSGPLGLRRSEINSIPVKLDFKPKRVDYGGLRSGRTTEFMNFFTLDEAEMVMKHIIVVGADGFDKLGQALNDAWMADIKKNQLPGILGSIAGVKSIVNVGSGVKDLVVVPIREYRKDGRVVRSIQKGAFAFAKNTSNELVKLGAKLAIGTQTFLQGAEDLLAPAPAGQPQVLEEEIDEDEAEKQISLYADQPVGVVQGLRGAFRGLERDLLTTRDAIIAVPGEVQESGSAQGAAKAVLKRAPTIVLRPAIGLSKAVGQTLLGAGNSMDPSNRRKMEDKYKRA